MTRRDTEIRYIESNTTYGPMPYGEHAGQPTVSLKLSSSENNSIRVNSLENILESRNWKNKLKSGYARLRIYGDNPFAERHQDSLEYLFDIIDPRFIDVELKDTEIETEPSTYIKRRVDTFSFFIDLTKDGPRYDEEVLQYISDKCASHGNGQYIFKSDTVMHEDDIRDFCREYKVYDSDVWVFPKGIKPETVQKNRETVESYAKRNTWNVSPRMDIEYTDEQTDETSE